jgi:hypothetical protein
MLWPYYLHLRSILEQRLGHAKAAADHAERALAMARELDIPSLQMPHFPARLAWARAALGDREGREPGFGRGDGAGSARRSQVVRGAARAPAGRGGHETPATPNAQAEGLSRVLTERRARGDIVFMPSRPTSGRGLANLALERGIETAVRAHG